MVRVLALVACGTRTIIDAVFGTDRIGELGYADQLLRIGPGRDDRAGRPELRRRRPGSPRWPRPAPMCWSGSRTTAGMPVCRALPDGSFVSRIGQVEVRVITAQVTITTSDSRRHRDLPAGHHRAGPGRARRRDRRALPRALGDRDLLRRAQVHQPGRASAALTHPDRGRPGDLRPADHLPGAADRDQRRHPGTGPMSTPTAAASPSPATPPATSSSPPPGSSPTPSIDLVGTIGRHVLAQLLPARRTRTNPRVVKRAISKYVASTAKGRHRGPSRPATITIDIQPILTAQPPP